MNGNGSELCITAGLSISNVELSGSVVGVLGRWPRLMQCCDSTR
jgi:hypothetical protein